MSGRRLSAVVLCALFATVAFESASALAQSGEGNAPASKVPEARSDRLDIFGAGMCHTCEWRPRDRTMRSPEQCGIGDDGQAKFALFECGRNPACEPVCNFLRCE
jgi:hypothetical protein